jgi:hypothetical protein
MDEYRERKSYYFDTSFYKYLLSEEILEEQMIKWNKLKIIRDKLLEFVQESKYKLV